MCMIIILATFHYQPMLREIVSREICIGSYFKQELTQHYEITKYILFEIYFAARNELKLSCKT